MPEKNKNTKLCKYCKSEIPSDAKICPYCRKRQGANEALIIASGLLLFFIVIGAFSGGSSQKKDEPAQANITVSAVESNTEASNKNTNSVADSVITTDMAVGETIQSGELTIGLSHVKVGNSITTALDVNTPASDGNEIIFVFFDVCNTGSKKADFYQNNVSAYADSSKVDQVADYFLFAEDGVQEYNSYELDCGTCAFVPMNFEVPRGWQKFTIFYNNYSWTVNSAEITNEPFSKASMYTIENQNSPTEIGYTTSADKYELQYDGFEIIPAEYNWSGPWVAYKFTITNTSSETLDLGLVGYNMRSYQNHYLMDDASYTVDNNLNGHINIFSVDEVKPGMTAKIYVAFEADNTSGDFMLTFDDGYIFDNVIDFIYASN